MIKELERLLKHFIEVVYKKMRWGKEKQSVYHYIRRFRDAGYKFNDKAGIDKGVQILDKYGYTIDGKEPDIEEAVKKLNEDYEKEKEQK